MSTVTVPVAGEDHYFGEPLALAIVAAVIIFLILAIARTWTRHRRPVARACSAPLEIVSPASSATETFQGSAAFQPRINYLNETPPQPQIKSFMPATMPIFKETHLSSQISQAPPNRPVTPNPAAFHSLHVASRPRPLTPPPVSASSVLSTSKNKTSYDSARSITPRRPKAAKAPLSEQRSEDAPEISDAADMMVSSYCSLFASFSILGYE